MRKILFFFTLLCITKLVFAQETFPTNGVFDKRDGHYAFTNAKIYKSYNQVIEKGTLVIKEGKIVAVGNGVAVPKDAIVVDLDGKTIYPSFIDLFTTFGMPEVKKSGHGYGKPPQMISKKDGAYSWNEALKTEFSAIEHFKYNAKAAKPFVNAGFGAVQIVRRDGISRGTSAVVSLLDEREHLTIIQEKSAHHMAFSKGSSKQSYPSSLMGGISLIRQTYMDAEWYKNGGHKKEKNLSLAAWNDLMGLPQFFEVADRLEILRAAKIGKIFDQKYIIKAHTDFYQRLDAIKATGSPLILSLNFPKAYDVEDPYDAQSVSLGDMKHWEMAPSGPGRAEAAQIEFALTTMSLEKPKDFLPNLRKAIKRGLSEEAALKALTFTPAKLLKLDQLGSLEKGKIANFIICSGNIFDKGEMLHNWIQGKAHVLKKLSTPITTGKYKLNVSKQSFDLEVSGKQGKEEMKIVVDDSTSIKVKHQISNNLISLSFKAKPKAKKVIRLSGTMDQENWKGRGTMPDGTWVNWSAKRTGELDKKEKDEKGEKDKKETKEETDKTASAILYPFVGFGSEKIPEQRDFLIKNATVWTNEKEGILQESDVLIKEGKISAVGKNLTAAGAVEIDGTGKHLTSGIIDEHSHIAISKGVNEGTQASSAEVSISDVVNSEDVNIYRQLSGGVTAAQLLHGSANPIGGQSAIIKMRWGFEPEEMKIKGAAPFIKFALGENVKQSNWGDNNRVRFPQTRMGVEQVFDDHFTRARAYEKMKASGQSVRKDQEMEALLDILNKKMFITCHSYQQGEITMLMRIAEKHGFRINTFTHILEGYKIADKMKKHGVAASSFSDWWAYKYEVIDAIPYNGAILHEQGVVTGFNSDDAEMGRRLNQEAAKAVMYGDVSEEEAWKFVSLNPAKMLHLDDRMGSIKKGKDADVVLWSTHPLSIYAKAEMTFIDGIKFFDREEDLEKRAFIKKERARLIQKMLAEKKNGGPTQPAGKKHHHLFHCDDVHDFMEE